MKRGLLSLVAMVLTSSALCAGQAPSDGPAFAGQMDPKTQAEYYINQTEKTVRLTDEQKAAITKIFEERQQAFTAAGGDMEKSHEVMKKYEASLQATLTDEQKASLSEARTMRIIKLMTDNVELTEEQIQRIKEILAKPPGDTPEAREARYRAIQNVLTPEQKNLITLNKAKKYIEDNFGQYKLTPEQTERAIEVWITLNEGFAGNARGNPKQYAAAVQSMREKVESMLTAEQRAAWEQVTADRYRRYAIVRVQYDLKVELTSEQKKDAEKLWDELSADSSLTNYNRYAEFRNKVKAILTPEQRMQANPAGDL